METTLISTISVLGGTGALGLALVERLAAAGYQVWIGSRDPAKAERVAAEVMESRPKGLVQGAGLADAAARCDLCVVAVPYAAHTDTLAQVKDAVAGKIVVDTTVPLMPPKVGTVQLPSAGSAAAEAGRALGEGARLVSALQNVGAEKLGSGGSIECDVLVCGDKAEDVETVRTLLAELGLKSWHAGPLANSAAAEALTSVLIQLNRRYKLGQAGIRITGGSGAAPKSLTVTAVPGLPLFQAGDDLAGAIGEAIAASGQSLKDGDVVVVAQKVVSKVEGRAVPLAGVRPGEKAREIAAAAGKEPEVVELVLGEAAETLRVGPNLVIVRNRLGHVLANAGVDASNVADGEAGPAVLLWPKDPDASARGLRKALQDRFGARIAVIVSDSLGRAWRMGTTGHAIGSAGIGPLRDRRGETDLFGRELKATIIGVADEIAAAASLIIGEAAEGSPVAIVRGAAYMADEEAGVGEILRPLDQDLFR
ncbi:MAG: coenzyme F420-0:L-glutamate ligase [Caulobacteraceae bacterium]|nr:coenzyme F420-0:L-glutamate ligase [Caulobacteraceae bacterium]